MGTSPPDPHPDERTSQHVERRDAGDAPWAAGAAPQGAQVGRGRAARLVGAVRIFAFVVGVLLVVEALRIAEPVLLPLVAGVFLAVLVQPIHRGLAARLPGPLRWLGLVVAMLTLVVGLAAFGGALALSARAVVNEFRERRPEIEAQLESARAAAERAGLPLPTILQEGRGQQGVQSQDGAPQGTQDAQRQEGGQQEGGFVDRTLRSLGAGLVGLLLALGFAGLGLAETGEARRRIAHTGTGGGARRALAVIDETVPAFRRFFWVKSLTSAITGVATWLAALAFGLPLAWVWGFLAFLLEYVPTVGSALAVIPPTLMALAEGGPGFALAVFLAVGALQVILGNFVDPRIEGRFMDISPFGVLLSIVFWGWLWGPAGALLAVPLTVALVIACRHMPAARGVATVLAGDGVPDPDEGAGR